MSKTVGSSKESMEWLSRELNSLNKMFRGGFKLDDDVRDVYVDKLKDLRIDYITETLCAVSRWKITRLPTIGEIRDEYGKISKRHNPVGPDTSNVSKPGKDPKKVFRETVMQCMYLYYKHHYDYISEFGCVKEAHAKMFGDEPYSFDRLKEKLPRDLVYKYIETNSSSD